MRNTICAFTAGLLALFAIGASASAAEWGSLKGRFLIDGTPQKLADLVVNKDQYCIDHKPSNNALVVGKDNSLVNVVVYLRAMDKLGKPIKIDIHPDYAAKLKESVVLDNHFCSFNPHVLLVRVGQQVVIKNSDEVGHNTNIQLFIFNQTIPVKDKVEVSANVPSSLPMPISCGIHPWMQAHLLSLNHPYMAASGDDGSFEIKNIPAGEHEFQFWHELALYLKNTKMNGGTTDVKGRAKLKIEAGKTLDLGDIKVPARLLKAQ
jgi:hypothetical protein